MAPDGGVQQLNLLDKGLLPFLKYDATCHCAQGLLLGEYLKALITGQGLPPDVDEQAKASPYYRQYDQARVHGLARPAALPRSNFNDAFEKLP